MSNLPKSYLIFLILLVVTATGLLSYGSNNNLSHNLLASVFDSDLLPSKDNTWNLGLKQSSRWQDARFSRSVGVGVDAGTVLSDNLVLGPTATSSGEGGQIKILGTTDNRYIVLDNYRDDLRVVIKGSNGREDEKVRIIGTSSVMNGGRVLIGTSSTMVPSEKLEVVGNIVSKGTEWTDRLVTLPAAETFNSVTYGNGLFVAVSNNYLLSPQSLLVSSDGINWASSTAPNNYWESVTYGNGLFVAVSFRQAGQSCNSSGGIKCVMTSPDGIKWTLRDAIARDWNSVTYGNGLFVAILSEGVSSSGYMTSMDGIKWTYRSSLPVAVWSSVTCGNGRFVAVTASGDQAVWSTNGIFWTTATGVPATNTYWESVTYGNGLFVAVSNCSGGSCVMTSPDGSVWTSIAVNNIPTTLLRSITYGNGLFVAVGGNFGFGAIMTSPDGINWTYRQPPFRDYGAIAYGNGTFVAFQSAGVLTNPIHIMTSGKQDQYMVVHNNIYQGGLSVFGSATGTLSVGTTSFNGIFTVATSSDAFTLTVDGKVGIGTSTPEAALGFKGGLKIVDKNNPNNYSEILMGGVSTTLSSNGALGTYTPIDFNFERGLTFVSKLIDVANLVPKEVGFVSSSGYWFIGGPEVPRFGKAGLKIIGDDGTGKGVIIAPTSSSLFITTDSGDIYIDAFRVGIGTTTPLQKLQVYGSIALGAGPGMGRIENFNQTLSCPGSGGCPSDIRFKKNIKPLVGSLDRLTLLKPTYFNWRAEEYPEFGFNSGIRILGLIAQDVEKVFPELIGVAASGFKTVDYTSPDLSVHLIEAIKELNSKTDLIGERIKVLEDSVSK